MNTKKLHKNFILSMLLTFCFASFSSNANLILSLDPVSDVDVSDSFVVNLFATTQAPGDAFIAWNLDFSFDTNLLSLDSLTISPAFSAFANPLSGQVPANIPFPPLPVSGINVLLASFNFTALASGNTSLSISAPLGLNSGFANMFGLPIQYNLTSTDVTVKKSASVPEPSTWILLLLPSLLLLNRKRSIK